VPQLVLFLFTTILLGPIFDFLVSGGKGFKMAYLFSTPYRLLLEFLTFFSPLGNGITIGIRLEALIILFFSIFIIYKVENSFKRALISGLILYITIFFFLSLPSFIALSSGEPLQFIINSIAKSATFANNLHGTLQYGSGVRAVEIGFNFLIGRIFFLLASLFSIIYFFLSQKEKTLAIFKNSRPERVAFHLLAVCLGLGLARTTNILNWNDYISLITLFLSFYFSWMFAVCVNDLADRKIDSVSNQNRPLVKNTLSTEDMRQASILFLLASLIGAFFAGYYAFFMLLSFTAIYFIYSAPPTRFKRIPFFSSFLIALCVLSEVMAGFFFLSNSKVVSAFPTKAIVLIILFAFLWSNIRDLKDIEGDRTEGIITAANLFGVKFVGLLAALAYLLIPLFIQINFLWLPALLAAFFTYFFSIKKPYYEFPLFLTYYLFILISGLILIHLF